MKMIKLSEEHYVLTDDSEIKEGDWVVSGTKTIVQCMYPENVHHEDIKKITHSTQPLEDVGLNTSMGCQLGFDKIEPLYLSEVNELLGVVDVEKKADEEYYEQDKSFENDIDPFLNYSEYLKVGFIDGYNQALEDNNHKKWTDADVIRIVEKSRETGLTAEYIILSLQPKTEWEVEFDEHGKLTLV